MQGPCCICTGPCCTQDIPFDIYAGTVEEGATPIGSIGKQFGGYIREALTNATNFSVTCKLIQWFLEERHAYPLCLRFSSTFEQQLKYLY